MPKIKWCTTLVIALDDGTHRTWSWDYPARGPALQEVRAQQRSRLHRVVRYAIFIGDDPPEIVDPIEERAHELFTTKSYPELVAMARELGAAAPFQGQRAIAYVVAKAEAKVS